MLVSEGQMSDYKGAALMIDDLPPAKTMLADRGYDADWFRAALAARGVDACVPSRINRKISIPYDQTLYRHLLARHSGDRTNRKDGRMASVFSTKKLRSAS